MCLYPKLIKNKKYTITIKNGGNVPEITDPRTKYVPVGCRKCIECKKKKGREWQVRLEEEIRTNKTGQFVTLTFNTKSLKKLKKKLNYVDKNTGEILLDGYELDNAIATLGVRKFLERWRKKYKVSVRHWLTTELGHKNTEHIHLHGIIFTNKKEKIPRIWKYGYVYIGSFVNEATVNYIIKYTTKVDLQHREYEPKILTSPGIGSNYTNRLDAQLNKYNPNGETREHYTTRQGYKMALPIYYRNKIYSEKEREKLWLKKLDQEERYVLGQKVSTKNEMEKYYKMLKMARAKNTQLGYGNDEINWSRKHYENQRRNMIMEKRLEKLATE